MSALGLDDRRSAGGVRSYAPRRDRRDDGDSIRPVLERLSRVEGREPGPRLLRKVVVHHLPPPDVDVVAKTSMPMLARLAIAAGAVAAAAAVGAGVFMLHDATQAAAPKSDAAQTADTTQASTLPKAVHTLAIRKGDDGPVSPTVVKDADRMPSTAPAPPAAATASAEATSAPVSALGADPLTSPLTSWAMLPADAPPPTSGAGQGAMDQAPPAHAAATKPEAHKTVRAHHARHVVRHRRHDRRSTAAAAPAQPVDVAPAQSQPIKKLPLQAAIDRLFSSQNAAAGAPPPPQQ